MTSKERIFRAMSHMEADRVPMLDIPWTQTVRRWEREGMPAGMDYRDYFEIDKSRGIKPDITPQYECKTIEETEVYKIYTSAWGVTMKEFKGANSTPEFLDYTVKDSTVWREAKKRMTVDESRLNLDYYKKAYPKWVADGDWINGELWFGFDTAHSWMSGTETILVAIALEPEWVKDIIDTYLDRCIAHFDMYWEKGFRFDSISWPDDMGYKGTAFFSNDVYRALIQPAQKRAVEWAHNKGVFASLHSCGDIRKLLPDIMETGIDCLNPIEVKAGMDPVAIKKQYGSRLTLHGGINAVLWDKKDEVIAEIENKVPILKEGGGYIFASDHSIPSSVSLENMKEIIGEFKKAGSFK